MPSTRSAGHRVGALQDVLSLLQDKPFRRYLTGQTLSGLGNALSVIALSFAVLSIDKSAAAVGIVMTASQIPKVIFLLIGGAIGDRYSRRVVMLVTDAGRCLLQATTAALLLLHGANVVSVALLQAASGLAAAMFAPAANGLIKNLAPAGRNREATALLSFTNTSFSIGGVALSGAIVAGLGPGVAFALDAVTFAMSTLSLALIRAPALRELAPGRAALLADLRVGLLAAVQLRWLVAHCAYVCLLNALALSPFFVLGPVVSARSLGGAPAWATIAICWGLGSIIGSAVAGRWAPQRPVMAAVVLSTLGAPVLCALALPLPLAVVAIMATIAGLQSALSSTIVLVAIQDHVPEHLLSRATAFESAGTLIAAPLGMGLTGVVAASLGTGPVLFFAAAWTLLSSIAAAAHPAIRSLQRAVSPSSTRAETRI